jgi:hypothetical protein
MDLVALLASDRGFEHGLRLAAYLAMKDLMKRFGPADGAFDHDT